MMPHALRHAPVVALLVAGAAVAFWPRAQTAPLLSPAHASSADVAVSTRARVAGAAAALSLEKPEAMRDVETYAAARLREIKLQPQLWKDDGAWRREFAAADTPELQREVLGLARQVGDAAFLALLAQALASSDVLVRLDAARSIGWLHEEHLADGITIGASAADPEMRAEVMTLAENAPLRQWPDILRRTLLASESDVQTRSIELIAERPSPALFALLVETLGRTSGVIQQSIRETMEGITRQRFATSAEAANWWAANAARFDETMLQQRQ